MAKEEAVDNVQVVVPSPRLPSIDLRTRNKPIFSSAYRCLRLNLYSCKRNSKCIRRISSAAPPTVQFSDKEFIRAPSPTNSDWSSSSLDEDEEDDETATPSEFSPSQQCYLTVCKRLKVIPSHKVLDSLTGEEICLRGHDLEANGAFAVAASLMNNASVKVLNLTSNNIGSDGTESIARMLEENIFIVELRLIENNIGEDGLRVLVDQLRSNYYIQILDLSGNRLEEGCAKYITDLLKENDTIEKMYLGHNNFREKGAIEIAYGIAMNRTVTELDLSWNHIRRDGAIAICDSMSVNNTIQKLDLSWNGLHWQGCMSLSRVLPVNETLLELDLTCNRIDNRSLEQLFKGIKKNMTLDVLKIGKNPITSDGIKDFLKSLETCKESRISELYVTGLTVDKRTIEIAELISKRRKFKLNFGIVLKQYQKDKEEDAFLDDDPMMVLMEFMKIKNMRLVDLFLALDADGSRSLSHQEFRDGLVKAIGIPMSPQCVNRLIRKLDRDKDGEVDYSELITGQREHKRRMKKLSKEEKYLPYDETELGKINIKLKKLLAKKSKDNKRAAIESARRNRSPSSFSMRSSSIATLDEIQ